MSPKSEAVPSFDRANYEYGNHPQLAVIRFKPLMYHTDIDPHYSLDHEDAEESPWPEEDITGKIEEVRDNYHIAFDPKSTESKPKQFGMTILNKDKLLKGAPALVIVSTSGSNLYNDEMKPNNAGNAVELAYTALKYPEQPIVYIECPGNGNSSDLDEDEYASAMEDGRLIHAIIDEDSGKLIDYEAFETMKALARVLKDEKITVSHISSNASGAHYSLALAIALKENTLEAAFLYNLTNISDQSALGLAAASLLEIARQSKYKNKSKDPLKLTKERTDMAGKILSDLPKRKIDLIRSSTHNPKKLGKQNKIFMHGNKRGQAAAVQVVAAQKHHKGSRQTAVFPEMAAQYRSERDFKVFMDNVRTLGGMAVLVPDIESLSIPMGQYGHSWYPQARQTLESFAFNRQD